MLKNFYDLEDRIIVYLSWSLGVIFLWFGLLKIFGYNPVYEIVYSTYPFLADGPGNVFLGILESAIGLGIILNKFPILTHSALFIHLLGTFLTFVVSPELMFDPYFPILTLPGEFVFKNVTLALAGLIVLVRLHIRKTQFVER